MIVAGCADLCVGSWHESAKEQREDNPGRRGRAGRRSGVHERKRQDDRGESDRVGEVVIIVLVPVAAAGAGLVRRVLCARREVRVVRDLFGEGVAADGGAVFVVESCFCRQIGAYLVVHRRMKAGHVAVVGVKDLLVPKKAGEGGGERSGKCPFPSISG